MIDIINNTITNKLQKLHIFYGDIIYGDRQGVLSDIVKDVVYPAQMNNFFREGRRVFGWYPLSINYSKWKEHKYPVRKMMNLEGRLWDSYKPGASENILKVGKMEIVYGTSVPYAIKHQTGYEPSNLKARIIMFVDQRMERDAYKLFRYKLQQVLNVR